MDYLIGNKVCFSVNESTLKNINTCDTLHLPPSAAFIFMMLIKHQGQTIERSVFFDSAWNDYGFELSGNTLNQYISLLRKNLRRLDLEDDFILTIPRTGFMLSTEVCVEDFTDKPIPRKKQPVLNWITLSLAFIFALEILYVKPGDFSHLNYMPELLGKIGGCEVYSSHNLTQGYKGEAIEIASALADKYLPCRKNAVYIFDIGGSLLFQKNGRAFLSRCDEPTTRGVYSGCQEVLIFETINQGDIANEKS